MNRKIYQHENFPIYDTTESWSDLVFHLNQISKTFLIYGSIPFHLYTCDHDLEQVSGILNCGVMVYVPGYCKMCIFYSIWLPLFS